MCKRPDPSSHVSTSAHVSAAASDRRRAASLITRQRAQSRAPRSIACASVSIRPNRPSRFTWQVWRMAASAGPSSGRDWGREPVARLSAPRIKWRSVASSNGLGWLVDV